MARSRLEVYWNSVETAPIDTALQVRVSDGSSDYLLPFACKLTPAGWVNAGTGSPLTVQPTWWKLFVETRSSKKVKKNSTAQRP
jgi:hypothetical protein